MEKSKILLFKNPSEDDCDNVLRSSETEHNEINLINNGIEKNKLFRIYWKWDGWKNRWKLRKYW